MEYCQPGKLTWVFAGALSWSADTVHCILSHIVGLPGVAHPHYVTIYVDVASPHQILLAGYLCVCECVCVCVWLAQNSVKGKS